MIKKILVVLIFALPITVFAQTKAVINGSLNNVKDTIENIYYSYRSGDSTVNGSVQVLSNKYNVTIPAETPLLIQLFSVDPEQQQPRRKNIATVYLDKGNNTIISTDSFSNIQVKESKAHAEYLKLTKGTEDFQKQMKELVKPYGELKKNNDTAGMRKIEEDYVALQNKMNEEVYGAYAKANPSSPVALYALNQYAGYDLDLAKIEPIYNSLSTTTKNSAAGKRFAKKLETAKATAVGAMAPLFTQADTSGKNVSLADFKGKYVLVDFWASWCGPCRAENPNVVAAFNKYKDKNFTVLGVSLDDEENDGQKKWLAAIVKDKLTWTQVSDLKGWKNSVAQLYGIQGIPQNFLLDPSGKIIAKNIRGEELSAKLAEVIK